MKDESDYNFDSFNISTVLFLINNLHKINTNDKTFIGRGFSVIKFFDEQNIDYNNIFSQKMMLLFSELGEFEETFQLAYLSTLTAKSFSYEDIVYLVGQGAKNLQKTLHIKLLRGFLEQTQRKNFAPQDVLYYGIESLKISSNIVDKRIIYLDDYLSITYGEKGLKNNRYGELMIAVQQLPNIWTFVHDPNNRVPIKSLRAAKNAVSKWSKFSLKGKLINNDHSVRISKFLGLKIKGKYACLNTSRGIGFSKK